VAKATGWICRKAFEKAGGPGRIRTYDQAVMSGVFERGKRRKS